MKNLFSSRRPPFGQFLLTVLVLLLPLAGRAQAPTWAAALAPTQLAGGLSAVRGTAMNAAGDVFVTGGFYGQIGFGSTVLTSAGDQDVFVAKWNTAAGTWAWATAGGGPSGDLGLGIAVSGSDVFVTGNFIGNANANAVRFGGLALRGASPSSSSDIFLVKYIDLGNAVAASWATAGGGTGRDESYGIAVSGPSVYVTGFFNNNSSNTNAVQFGGVSLAGSGPNPNNTDMFVAAYTDAGSSATYRWAVAGGGVGGDVGTAIAVSGTKVYVTGYFTNNSSNANAARFGGATLNGASSVAGIDVFVAAYTDAGSSATYRWATAGGGTGSDSGRGIAVSGTGVYVTGAFSNDTANSSAAQFGGVPLSGASTSSNSQDIFLAKYLDAGSSMTLAWATADGGTGDDAGQSIAVSGAGVYFTGSFTNNSSNANGTRVAGTALNGTSGSSSQDMFVAKYLDAGSAAAHSWASAGGGMGGDLGFGLAVHGGQVAVGGTVGPPASFGSFTLAGSGIQLGFGAMLHDAAPVFTAISPASGAAGSRVTLTGTGLGGATAVTFSGPSGNTVTTGFVVNAAGTSITGIVVPAGAVTGTVTVTTPAGTGGGVSFTVALVSAVAGPQATLAAQVQAYPSPAHGTLNVRRPAGPATMATLLNALGQVVRVVDLPAAETAVDVAGLASGVYALRLTLSGQLVTKRVVLD